jgi:peroxiredoxin
MIEVGQVAPDFGLRDQNGEKVSLNQFKGEKHLVLSFHVLSFTGG